MASKHSMDVPHRDESIRWAIGLYVSYRCRRVEGVLIATSGRGGDAWIDIKAAKSLDVPDATAALFRQLSGTLTENHPARRPAHASRRVGGGSSETLRETASAGPRFPITAFWPLAFTTRAYGGGSQSSPQAYLSLCDAARSGGIDEA